MRVILGLLLMALFQGLATKLFSEQVTDTGLANFPTDDLESAPQRELELNQVKETKIGRKLTVTPVTASDKVPKRNLALFSSDEKTREIHKLRKGIVNSEGLIRQYQGSVKRRGSHARLIGKAR